MTLADVVLLAIVAILSAVVAHQRGRIARQQRVLDRPCDPQRRPALHVVQGGRS